MKKLLLIVLLLQLLPFSLAAMHNNPEASALIAACFGIKDTDLAKVKQLLQAGVSPNARRTDSSGVPLYYAATFGEPDIVQELLDYGAEVNTQLTPFGNTPLQSAVQKLNRIMENNPEDPAKQNYIDIVYLLLKAGANPHLINNLKDHQSAVSVNKIPLVLDLFKQFATH